MLAAIQQETKGLTFPFDLEPFYPSHPSVTSFPSGIYTRLDKFLLCDTLPLA
jgi:hypothetical protein